MNVLVGPNNAGKSTILAAFRILESAMRRATSRRAEPIHGPAGATFGHTVDVSASSVAEENFFHDYDFDEPAHVRFRLSNGNSLTLHFPEREVCHLIPDAQGQPCLTPSAFRKQFRCPIGFVPILGPVEHRERLYERDAARLALSSYSAARNFRNIWYHYPERFDEFRTLVRRTWPGMDVERPEVERSYERARLMMWCPEERKPREIFWTGFGFQVWCQMLTHLIQSQNKSIFLIDEPDIYLHADLQRQLLGILRDLGPDILIATHSTEIVTEAETEHIVLVDKRRRRASRIRHPGQLEDVFQALGSGLNPVLTQLAKTRRVLFVEGLDFRLLARFARKLGFERVATRADFAVVPVEGFNPERIRSLKSGMEATLGTPIHAAAVLDRDYRTSAECEDAVKECKKFCDLAVVHESKEIENFLLVPEAIDRAAAAKLADRAKRGHDTLASAPVAAEALQKFADGCRHSVLARLLSSHERFERSQGSTAQKETLAQDALSDFDRRWLDLTERMRMIPGKEALSAVNVALHDALGTSVTPVAVVEAMRAAEVPAEVAALMESIDRFARGAE